MTKKLKKYPSIAVKLMILNTTDLCVYNKWYNINVEYSQYVRQFKVKSKQHVNHCIKMRWAFTIIQTVTVVVLKQDVNTVDVVNSSKINFPPHIFVWRVRKSYCFCPHARFMISINGHFSTVRIGIYIRCWLCSKFIVG